MAADETRHVEIRNRLRLAGTSIAGLAREIGSPMNDPRHQSHPHCATM